MDKRALLNQYMATMSDASKRTSDDMKEIYKAIDERSAVEEATTGRKVSPQSLWEQMIRAQASHPNPAIMEQGFSAQTPYYQASSKLSPTDQKVKSAGYELGTEDAHKYAQKLHANQRVTPVKYLTPADANRLVYLDGRPVPPYTPLSELRGNVRSVTPQDQKDFKQKQKSLHLVGKLRGMLFGDDDNDAIFGDESSTAKGRVSDMVTANVERVVQSDPKYRNYSHYSKGTIAPLAKSLGQVGSLSDRDLDLISNLVPSITGLFPDSPEVAKKKLDLLDGLINAGMQSGQGITKKILDQHLEGSGFARDVDGGLQYLGEETGDASGPGEGFFWVED